MKSGINVGMPRNEMHNWLHILVLKLYPFLKCLQRQMFLLNAIIIGYNGAILLKMFDN